MLFFVGAVLDTSARITRSPRNVIVLEGENATLHCSSDAGLSHRNNPITWTYDGDIKASSCVSHNRDFFLVYSPNSTTDCNLVVLPGGGRLVAGPYACDDSSRNSRRALAMIIALGKSTFMSQPPVKAKFHYAIWFEPASNPLRTS